MPEQFWDIAASVAGTLVTFVFGMIAFQLKQLSTKLNDLITDDIQEIRTDCAVMKTQIGAALEVSKKAEEVRDRVIHLEAAARRAHERIDNIKEQRA